MTTILDLIAADPNVAPALRAAMPPARVQAYADRNGVPPTWFRPQCGRHGRTFQSQADADAYSRGWFSYPAVPSLNAWGGPEWTGYMDAESDQQARDDARMERAAEERHE